MPVVAQAGDDAATAVARTYREFGRLEARGRSAAYEALAESVAGDTALVSFIASLPPEKRQPNLLFAAARYLLGAPPAIGPLRELASQSRAELTQVILTRRTQTNEPARCAVLLPALAQLPQPLGEQSPAPSAASAPPGCPASRPASCPARRTRQGRAYLRPGPRRPWHRPGRQPRDMAAMVA